MNRTASLRQRLLDAPFNLLSASSSSASTLSSFAKEWSNLREDVDEAIRHSLLDQEDLSLAHMTASLIATLGSGFLDINRESTARASVFIDEVESIFSKLSLDDATSSPSYHRPSKSIVASVQPSTHHFIPTHHPIYIGPAYAWILENIHDPYPSTQIKRDISQAASVSVRVLSEWFKEVRRRIGWVTLCKTHFQGSRALAVEAAYHVFIKDDPAVRMSSRVISDFEEVRQCLQNLSSLDEEDNDGSYRDLDSLVYSTFPDEPDVWSPLLPISSHPQPLHYPSPSGRSRSLSSTPSLVFTSDDESDYPGFDIMDPPMNLGKRKMVSGDHEIRLAKRRRSDPSDDAVSAISDDTHTILLSLPETWDAPLPDGESHSPILDSVPTPPLRKRRLSNAAAGWASARIQSPPGDVSVYPQTLPKRRASTVDSQPVFKRPCCSLPFGPRKQAVSDPLPRCEGQFDPVMETWFKDTFELPDAAPLEPLSIELFTNWSSLDVTPGHYFDQLLDPMPCTTSSIDETLNLPPELVLNDQTNCDISPLTCGPSLLPPLSSPSSTITQLSSESLSSLSTSVPSVVSDLDLGETSGAPRPGAPIPDTEASLDLQAFIDALLTTPDAGQAVAGFDYLSPTSSAIAELDNVEELTGLLDPPPI